MKSQKNSMKNILQLSFKEEVANSISHGLMALSLLFLLPYAAIRAYLQAGGLLAFGNSVFLFSLLAMFFFSSLYHATSYQSQHKYIFRILDHSMIFVAIAGSYTPILLYGLGGTLGWALFIFQWLLVFLGILYKTWVQNANPKLSVAIYLSMGWIALLILPQLVHKLGWNFVLLMGLGGVFYSWGSFFYLQQEKKYYHLIWHLFINLAAFCHLVAIIFWMQV